MSDAASVKGLHHVAFAEGPGAGVIDTFQRVLGLSVTSVERAPVFIERMLFVGNCSLQAL